MGKQVIVRLVKKVELTKRQQIILQGFSNGASREEIMNIVEVSDRTLSYELNNIIKATGTSNLTHLVAFCLRNKLIK